MRILVVSDTHGNDSSLRRAILAQPKAEVVIHLGDGEEELLRAKRAFPEKMFLAVRGNCDFGSDLPLTGEFTAQGVKIFYTHGHYYGVKSGLYTFACAARERGAQVALYGHTHNCLLYTSRGLQPWHRRHGHQAESRQAGQKPGDPYGGDFRQPHGNPLPAAAGRGRGDRVPRVKSGAKDG